MAEKTGLAKLREPFKDSDINLLPKQLKSDKDQPRYQCKEGTQASHDGKHCGGYHGRAIHLDYVGHAALTSRLLEVDPEWSWEPLAIGQDGLPVFDRNGGLWIKLTICGMTRIGYGDASGKQGGNAVKEAIGDGLRNAGMRFGAALDLWHKGDLYEAKNSDSTPSQDRSQDVSTMKPWDMGQAQKAISFAKGNEGTLRKAWGEAQSSGADQAVLDAIKAAAAPKEDALEGTVQ